MMRMKRTAIAGVVAATLAAGAAPGLAGPALARGASVNVGTVSGAAPSRDYAPVNRPGPAYTTPKAKLATSLQCTGNLRNGREPVLLVPATAVNSHQNFSWSYEIVLKQKGIPFCTSDLPGTAQYNMDDIQNRADYLVYAIRTMSQASGQKIAMIGSSQGGEAARWALRFWPDTRSKVADVVALDSPNHGTLTANPLCAVVCQASLWQQTYQSNYMRALNSGQETFAGISYTNISTLTDDVVEPNLPGKSTVWLDGPGDITNVHIQSICPGTVAEHLLVATTNPIASSLTVDAITHNGPGSPKRVPRSVCTAGPFIPTVPAATSTQGFANATAAVAANVAATGQKLLKEPKLRSYVYAG